MRLIFLIILCLMPVSALSMVAAAQEPDPAPAIEAETQGPEADAQIEERLTGIFAEIPALSGVDVEASAGVVSLTGTVPDADALAQATSIASRVTGVVAVQNDLTRDVSVDSRLAPAGDQLRDLASDTTALLPVIGIALGVFAVFLLLGLFLGGRRGFWRRVTPNTFIAGMVGAVVRAVFILIGIILALTILDAIALLGAFLGAAGVIGLAIGFAVQDTIENFVASIMLSLRQPFRPNDLVDIDGKTGHVVRLTSRATVLMTPDGNHLRIPNAQVFKAVIENYTRNPERRFAFELGVDAEDDPQAAIDTAIAEMKSLDFVLADPPPAGWIEKVGDSNIVLTLTGWIDQDASDFNKARSQAIRVAKTVLERDGFTLPEPIYRLRIDGLGGGTLNVTDGKAAAAQQPAEQDSSTAKTAKRLTLPDKADTAPDRVLETKVAEDRAEAGGDDLLSSEAPTEFGDAGRRKN